MPPKKVKKPEHLKRFTSGPYNFENFALLNFAMERRKGLVLPRDTQYHNKVYTYVHSTNTLYRGNQAIRAPAVKCLPCQTPLKNIVNNRKQYYHSTPLNRHHHHRILPSLGRTVMTNLISLVKKI